MTIKSFQENFKATFGCFEFIDSQGSLSDGAQTKLFDVVAPSGQFALAVLVDMTATLTNGNTSATVAPNTTNAVTGAAPTTLDLFLSQMYVKPTVSATYRSDTLISTDAALIEQLSFNLNKRTYPFATAPSVAAATSSSVEATLFVPCGGAEAVWYSVVPVISNAYPTGAAGISIASRTFNVYGIYGTDDDVVVFHTAQSDVKPVGSSSLLDQYPDNISADLAVLYGPSAAYVTQLLATTPDRVILNALDAAVLALTPVIYPDLATTFSNEIVLAPRQERFRTFTVNQSSSAAQRTLWMQFSSPATSGPPPANPATPPQTPAIANVVGGAAGPSSSMAKTAAPGGTTSGSRGGIIPRRVA
ncbi:MAG: hypothetical protein ACREEC_04280 [Thermoplasmata archaeon]